MSKEKENKQQKEEKNEKSDQGIKDVYYLYGHNKKIEVKSKKIDDEEIKSEEEIYKKVYDKIEDQLKMSISAENLVILTGAGSSIGKNGGKTMEELWNEIEEDIYSFNKILQSINYKDDKNLENLLSRLEIEKESLKNKGENSKEISTNIEKIRKKIKEKCSFKLDKIKNVPHQEFLKNILESRKLSNPRLKIFTLNYDTLFEQAADNIGAIVNDGFSFSQSKILNTNDFDLDIIHREKTRITEEENFYDKVFHLYKLHGSIDWYKNKKEDQIIKKSKNSSSPLIIYPSTLKYKESYQMPFFEMISRFQMTLRKENVCLIIIGYSFSDEHINSIIDKAIDSTNLEVIIINPKIFDLPKGKEFQKKINNNYKNITLIADKFNNFSKNLPKVEFENIFNNDKKKDEEGK
jgi:NAD-dependent SIR2 family protein deacetylase